MPTMDVPSELKLTSLRKQNLRKTFEEIESHSSSVLFLALQWKDIESHFDSVEKSISHRHDQLASLEDSLRKRHEDVKLREERIESVQESVDRRFREFESREANEKSVFEERAKKLDLIRVSVEERSREVEVVQRMVEQGLTAFDLKEKGFRILENSIDDRSKELEAVQKSVKESLREIELKERQLGLIEESVGECEKEIELREKRVEEWSKQIKLEEKQFEETVKEVELREKRILEWEKAFDSKERRLEECVAEVELREKRILEWEKAFDSKERRLAECVAEVELREKRIPEWEKAFDSKERRLEERYVEVELREKRILEWERAFDSKERRLEERSVEVELKDKRVKERAKELELKEMKFEECAKAFSLKEKRWEDRCMEIELERDRIKERDEKLELKEKIFDECTKEINLKEKILEEPSVDIEIKENGIVERSREIELKENKLEHSKVVELKEKPFEHCSQVVETKERGFAEIVSYEVESEAFETLSSNNIIDNSACNNARLSGYLAGNSLLVFLNEHYEEHDLVSTALRTSSDPGKLVLDAMQGFYPLDAENGNKSVELRVIRKSCIFLLEELVRISPEIKLNVKDEATKLAFYWITKMRTEAENHMEVLGFLLLLAAYGLASAFDYDELMTYLLVVARDRQAPQLCRILGLVDKISDFIHNLITEKRDLGAIRLIYAFKLVGELQPVDLLKTYLRKSKQAFKISCRIGGNSRSPQITAFNKRIAEIKALIRCIEEHNLEYELSPRKLQFVIADLYKRKATIMRKPSTRAVLTSAPSSWPTPNIQQQQPRRINRPGTDVSAAGALNASPSANSSNHLIQFPHQQPLGFNSEVSSVILTQGEIKQTKLANSQKNNTESCNVSLWQLMNVSPELRPHWKAAATKLAATLKMKLNGEIENRVDVLHFLKLLVTYELASSFDADELFRLFKHIYRRKQAPDLCRALGLADEIPDFVQNLIQEKQWREAVRYVFAFDLKHKFPLVPLLKDYLSYSKKVAEEKSKKENKSPDEAQIGAALNKEISASRIVLECIAVYNLESEYPPKILEDRIAELENQKASIVKVLNSNHRKDRCRPVTGLLLQQTSERKHTALTTVTAATTPAPSTTNSPTPAPVHVNVPAPTHEVQPQMQSGNKRPRITESAEFAPNDTVGTTSTIHSEQNPAKRNASSHRNHNVHYSTVHYSLNGFPPVNNRTGLYPNMPMSHYSRDALHPGYYNRPVAYGGPCQAVKQPDYYDHPMSFGGHGDGYKGPDYHTVQAHSGGYGLHPQYHPSFNP